MDSVNYYLEKALERLYLSMDMEIFNLKNDKFSICLILICLLFSNCGRKSIDFIYKNGNLFLSDSNYVFYQGVILYDTVLIDLVDSHDTIRVLELITKEKINPLINTAGCRFGISKRDNRDKIIDIYPFVLKINNDTIMRW
jgi:hypothetical protein